MAKTLAQATKKPSNIGDPVPAPAQPLNVPPVATTVPRELPGLGRATLGPTPSIWTTPYDSVKQFYRPGTSQQRFPPLPTKANPAINAQAASVATTIVNNSKATPSASGTSTFVQSIPVNKQSVSTYVVKLADLANLDTFSNNAGGTIVLPGATLPAGSFSGGSSSTNKSSAAAPSGTALYTGAVISVMNTETDLGGPNTSPSGSGWVAIDAAQNGIYASVFSKLVPTGTFTASYPLGTTVTWVDSLMFFGNCNIAPVAIQTLNIFSGGTSGTEMHSGTFALPVTPGNAILVVATVGNAPWDAIHSTYNFSNFSVTDGINSYGQIGSGSGGTSPGAGVQQSVFLATNVVGGSTTVTVDIFTLRNANGSVSVTAYEISLGTAKPIPSGFPAGWYCYLENTGTGTFTVESPVLIDGSSSSFTLGPNQGSIVVFDGTNWFTERGLGGGTPITFPLSVVNGGTGTSTPNLIPGTNIAITGTWPDQTISGSGGASGAPQSVWTWPDFAPPPNNMNPVNSGSMNFSANQIKFMYIHIDAPLTVGHFAFLPTTADPTNKYDWGMYTTTGTLVWNLGAQTFNASSGQIIVPFVQGTISISPGNYWLAFTGNGTGLTFQSAEPPQISEYFFFANVPTGTGPLWWTSSTASSGGALPSSPVIPAAPTAAGNLTNAQVTTVSAGSFPIIALMT